MIRCVLEVTKQKSPTLSNHWAYPRWVCHLNYNIMKFGKKYSISAFKALHNADSLVVIKNPKNGKLFVSADGVTVAAVSKNYKASEPKEFVELLTDKGIIMCLHNQGTDNVVETL